MTDLQTRPETPETDVEAREAAAKVVSPAKSPCGLSAP